MDDTRHVFPHARATDSAPGSLQMRTSPEVGPGSDIFQRLLKERIVFIGSAIDQDTANLVCSQLILLEAENQERDIAVYINSPGGSVTDGLAIYDTIAIQAEQIIYLKRMMAERIAFHTGQPIDRIEADSDRDRWFTAEEAREYGFIDEVIQKDAMEVPKAGAGASSS